VTLSPLVGVLAPLGVSRGQGVTLLTDLIAYYKCDEASGNLLDAHTNALHLTATNAPGSAAGKINTARQFVRTSSQWFSRPDDALLSGGNRNLFFSVWVSLNSTGNDLTIFFKGTGATGTGLEYRLLWSTGAATFRFQVGGGGLTRNVDVAPSPVSTGVWYHLMCWHDADNDVIAIALNNGTPVTFSYSLGLNDTAAAFAVGATSAGASFHNGLLDEFGIWGRIPSVAARTALYNAGAGLAFSQYGSTGA
jgi:hypothetical protein